MDELARWVGGPECAALGRALVHSLWQGAALAALLALVNSRLGARARYGAACLALAAMLVSAAATVAVCFDAPVRGAPVSVPSAAARVLAAAPDAGLDWMAWLAPAWAAGVMIMSLRLALAWACARRLVRLAGPPLPSDWQAAARSLAVRMGVKPVFRLLGSARVAGPAVVGWLRPAVLVPAGALCGLSAEQLEAVLAHELAHLARRDALVNLLESAAEVLLFYHPAFWWISSRIRRERENCCDDLAVAACGSAHLYAEALLRLEEARPPRRTLVYAARDGDLLARIRRLLQPPVAERLEWGVASSALAGLLVVAAMAAAVTAQEIPRPSPAPTAAKPQVSDQEEKRRIEHANQRYREGSTPGSQTERGRVYVRFGPPDEVMVQGGYERWFYPRIPGVGNNVSFEFGLDRKPADNFLIEQEALRAQRQAAEEQLLATQLSLARLRKLSEQERAMKLHEVTKARQAMELLLSQIQSLEAELSRLKARQQLEKRP